MFCKIFNHIVKAKDCVNKTDLGSGHGASDQLTRISHRDNMVYLGRWIERYTGRSREGLRDSRTFLVWDVIGSCSLAGSPAPPPKKRAAGIL